MEHGSKQNIQPKYIQPQILCLVLLFIPPDSFVVTLSVLNKSAR